MTASISVSSHRLVLLPFVGICAALFGCSSDLGCVVKPATSDDRSVTEESALPESGAPALPLSTRGRYIVDADGNRFKLASVNWYGASDARNVAGGLDTAPLADIVGAMRALGFNSVRLP